MYLIFGLGNPGKKYEKTRHNIGARITKNLESLNLENATLAKPETFMNESGKATKKFLKDRRLKADRLIVIHDDIDLPLGKIKVVKNRGSAGHKGVQSVIDELKTKDFWRVRVGICPAAGKPAGVDNFVIRNFTKEEEKILEGVIKKTTEEIIKLTS
jgi:peptidyl-tRNA hydrolase, PTH1 family